MKRKEKLDHTKLLCDVGELTALFADSPTLEIFLQKTVEMVAHHMLSDVCSIYLYHEGSCQLTLKATVGLNKALIGNVHLNLGEGLTGLALKELRPICERHASQNANFRYFPELGEETYESFLVVPIVRGTTRIGAMVIQNAEANYFIDEDIRILKAITTQLATAIEMTRLIFSIEDGEERQLISPELEHLSLVKGKVGAQGIAYGEIIIKRFELIEAYAQRRNARDRVITIQGFKDALLRTERQLEELQQDIEAHLSDVASLIFTAQILMLKDKVFIDAIIRQIEEGLHPVEAVVHVVGIYVQKFKSLDNPLLKEKSQDVGDIGKRLIDNLVGAADDSPVYEDRIVVARELFPSDALKLFSQKVKGIVLLSGGETSHVAILAQSLNIPLIIVNASGLLLLPEDARLLIDANEGDVYVNPSKEIVDSFKSRLASKGTLESAYRDVDDKTLSEDGTRVHLLANVNLLEDAKAALAVKAEGVGLYRTEFPFMVRQTFPSEEEQYVIYKKLVATMGKKDILFRTLDIGGDKVLAYFQDSVKEHNPFLGLRSIRFSLKHQAIFQQQIRAILRAGPDARLHIMFPMISSVDEFQEAKAFVNFCRQDLCVQKIACPKDVKIGLMIELPSTLAILEPLIEEADFVSIGTNDLVQYLLAVDRTNERVSDLYRPHHPAVLRALDRIVSVSRYYDTPVSICGDMAHHEVYLKFLLGIGLRRLSMSPVYLPKVQRLIQSIKMSEAQEMATRLLQENSIMAIERILGING